MRTFAKIQQNGLRLTQQRRAVIRVLEQSRSPRTAQQMVTAAAGVDRSSVFRTLKAFAARGIVEVTENARHERLYELPRTLPHHHLVCERCGRARTIRCFLPSTMLRSWAKRYGFQSIRHESGAFGICRACHREEHSRRLHHPQTTTPDAMRRRTMRTLSDVHP